MKIVEPYSNWFAGPRSKSNWWRLSGAFNSSTRALNPSQACNRSSVRTTTTPIPTGAEAACGCVFLRFAFCPPPKPHLPMWDPGSQDPNKSTNCPSAHLQVMGKSNCQRSFRKGHTAQQPFSVRFQEYANLKRVKSLMFFLAA